MTSLTDLLLKQKSQTLTIHFIFDLYLQQQVTLYLLIASAFVYNMMMNSPYWGAVWANRPPPTLTIAGRQRGGRNRVGGVTSVAQSTRGSAKEGGKKKKNSLCYRHKEVELCVCERCVLSQCPCESERREVRQPAAGCRRRRRSCRDRKQHQDLHSRTVGQNSVLQVLFHWKKL